MTKLAQCPLWCDGCHSIITKGKPYSVTDGGLILCAACCSPAAPV